MCEETMALTDKLHIWMNDTEIEQQKISDSFESIWDEFNRCADEYKYLFKKIALYLFGYPENVEDFEKDDYGLPKDKKALVNGILEKCINHSFDKDKVRIGIIYVFVYLNEDVQTLVPLIRVMTNSDKQDSDSINNNAYIDHLSRIYKNFDDYKANNTWDLCWLGLPQSGYYSTKVEIIFLNQSSRGKLLQKFDKFSNITNIAMTVSTVAGAVLTMFPPTAPIGAGIVTASMAAGTPTALYGVGRSINTIADRKKYKQGINLSDAEARQCWLTIATGIVSVGALSSAKILASSARAGKTLSASARTLCTSIGIGSLTMSGISILNSAYELNQKGRNNITKLDILQFSTSLFFFGHSVVSFKSASTIIQEIQESEIQNIKQNLSPEHHEKYDAYYKSNREVLGPDNLTNKESVIQAKAKFIRKMKTIDNIDDFFKQFRVDKRGQFHINNELTVPSNVFSQLSKFQEKKLRKLSKQLNENKISLDEFNQYSKRINKKRNIIVERVQNEQYLKKIYNVKDVADIKIGSRKLDGANRNEINRLNHVFRNSLNNGDKDYIAVTTKMAEKMNLNSVNDFCALGDFVSRKMKLEIKTRLRENPNPKGPGVKGKEFYKTQVTNELLTGNNKFNSILKEFHNHMKERKPVGNKHFNKIQSNKNIHFQKGTKEQSNLGDKKINRFKLDNDKPPKTNNLVNKLNNVSTDSQKNRTAGSSKLKNSPIGEPSVSKHFISNAAEVGDPNQGYSNIIKSVATVLSTGYCNVPDELKQEIYEYFKKKVAEKLFKNSKNQRRSNENVGHNVTEEKDVDANSIFSTSTQEKDEELENFEKFLQKVIELAESKGIPQETIFELSRELFNKFISNNVEERVQRIVPNNRRGNLTEKEVEKISEFPVNEEILEEDEIQDFVNVFHNKFSLSEKEKKECNNLISEEKIIKDNNIYMQNKNFFYESYFKISQEMVGSQISNFNLSILDDEITCTLFSEEHGPMVIKYVSPDKISGTATLYKLIGGEAEKINEILYRLPFEC